MHDVNCLKAVAKQANSELVVTNDTENLSFSTFLKETHTRKLVGIREKRRMRSASAQC
jgi:hypothetical protein